MFFTACAVAETAEVTRAKKKTTVLSFTVALHGHHAAGYLCWHAATFALTRKQHAVCATIP
jgi:hypothetical protein